MTRAELRNNLGELLGFYTNDKSLHGLNESIAAACERLIDCGAIALDDEPADSMALAKCILTVALENVAPQYSPMTWDVKRQKIVKNLRCF